MSNGGGLTCALIGTGMVAKTHLAALRAAAPRVTLRGVAASREDSARRFAEAAGGDPLHIYPDARDVAADSQVDVAVITTPPNVRLELIEPLARAGKHILLEKPVGRTAEEAEKVVRICEAAGVSLGIFFQHRMRAASRKAAEMVASGRLGALGVVEIAVPWWREQDYYDEPGRGSYARDGGGVLISQAIHTIDLALSLAGPVASVQAMTATTRFHDMEAEDFATAGLRFADGAAGSLVAGTASFPGGAETIVLHFEAASLHLGSGVLSVRWRDGREETHGAEAGTGGGADPMAFTHDWHQAIVEDFVDALEEGRAPVASGRAALPAHRLIDAIALSAAHGRCVEVPQ
ncbi:Predicted dehydrogenase [Roseivivax sediminis]|uniref:Predicted dehydrogenase n=1 Tax=Roseivivax sediminis TaxID=936889 RepID=A0A1I1VZU7_9RHOB|nr:Predicted dehydrogenase [Roseivivax sediminis]